jgi:hypothetical protein
MGRPRIHAGVGLIFSLSNFLQMSTITKSLSGFIFNGSALALASASFKGNLNSISGFNAAGTGYTSYRPTNAFNSLTQLQQDGVYIVDAKTTGFDIPGATLTAIIAAPSGGGAGPGPLSLTLSPFRDGGGNLAVNVGPSSTESEDTYVLISFDKGYNNVNVTACNDTETIAVGTVPVGDVVTAKLVNRNGNILTQQFTAP